MANPQTKKLTDTELQRLIQLIEKTKWNYQLQNYETAALEGILKTTRKARQDISKKLKLIKPDATFSKERLNAIAEELQDLTVAVQSQITDEITDVAMESGAASYSKHNDILSFDGFVPDFNPVTLTDAQLYAMIVETPIGGQLLNEWVERTFEGNIKEAFKAEVVAGMLQGESYTDLIKRFDTVAFAGLDRDIETLVKSYVQSINVQAAKDVAMANKDLVKGWKWNATCENRTCIQCMSLDARDTIYKIDEGPEIPAHPRCRCFPEMITKTFRELGIDVDEIEEAYRPYTVRDDKGKIIDHGKILGTYEDFLKTQPKNIQMEILGPSRWKLWDEGLPLGDLTKKDGAVKLLKELGQ